MPWFASGFGPAGTPLELHRNDEGSDEPGGLPPPRSEYWTMFAPPSAFR